MSRVPDPAVSRGTLRVTPGGAEVTTLLVRPPHAVALLVLGHGSETPAESPLMVRLADALAGEGVATLRYNYPYSEGKTLGSPVAVDSLDVLLATAGAARAAGTALAPPLPLFLGGRSMSAQVTSLALSRESWPEVRGGVLYVFPTRWHVLLSDAVGHLHRVPVPMLFVQAGRDDELAPVDELRPVLRALGARAALHIIDGADHAYDVPAASGEGLGDALSEVASVTGAWIRQRLRADSAPRA